MEAFRGGVQVARLVATPGGSWGGDQVLWKLSGVEAHEEVGMATRFCGSCKRSWCRLQDLLQYLEEVEAVTRAERESDCGSTTGAG